MPDEARVSRRSLRLNFSRPLLAGAMVATAASPLPAMAAFDLFLKLQGIDGESQDDKHKKEIDLISYSFGLGNAPSSAPRATVKPSCGPLDVMKRLDKASPKLMLAAMTGSPIPSGVMTFRKSGGDPLEFYVVEMTNITVARVTQSGASAIDNTPVEAVSVRAGTYKFSYKPQKPDGSLDASEVFAWDCATNQPI